MESEIAKKNIDRELDRCIEILDNISLDRVSVNKNYLMGIYSDILGYYKRIYFDIGSENYGFKESIKKLELVRGKLDGLLQEF